MTAQIDRLTNAIQSQGYETMAEFARAANVREGTLRAQIARGSIPKSSAAKYARRLKVSVEWLLYGQGNADSRTRVSENAGANVQMKPLQADVKLITKTEKGRDSTPRHVADMSEIDSSAIVYELDVRASAGAGAVVDNDDVKDLWVFPVVWVRVEMQTAPQNLRIVTVEGDSMVSDPPRESDILPGDKVVLDIEDRTVSPPGVFIIHDGMGLVAKRCEYIPQSDPPRMRIMSNNPKYSTYEISVDEAYCMGRIKGRWQRIS